MTRRQKILATLVTAAAAVGAFIEGGTMPAPVPGAVGVTFQMRGPCRRLQALAVDPADVDCQAGERVYVTVEVAADMKAGLEEDNALPPGVQVLKQSFRRATLQHPDRVLTVLGNTGADRCLGGEVRRARGDGTYWTPPRGWGPCCGEGCECAGARCAAICPSHVYAGDTCAGRICRRWPGLEGCDDG